ncbi:MAG: anti-sigma factor family protein [Candidatus Dormibacteraceae bacterium]
MAHLNDGTLRRMVDDPDARAGADERHLETCADCQSRFQAASKDASAIATLLAVREADVNVARAYQRVRSTPQAQPRFGFRLPLVRPGSRPLILGLAATIAALALLVVGLAEGGVVFAPSTLTPVPVTLADMQSLSQLSAYGTITWSKQPNVQVATTPDEAKSATGLTIPTVGPLPNGVSSTVTYVSITQAVAVFTFSATKAAAAAASSGKTLPTLPAGIVDGSTLTVTVGPAVGEIYGDLKLPSTGTSAGSTGNGSTGTGTPGTGSGSDIPANPTLPQLIVGESVAPSATTSSNVTVAQLEQYLVSIPGMSADLKAAILAIKDPSTTLPIPIPVGFATSSTVDVDGTPGLALGDNTGLGSGVIWVKSGLVYAVAGTIHQTDALTIARNIATNIARNLK